ncbi:MAG: hypothetical protein EOM41_08495 [Bacilli bacterium]|nr:hypothetical protein [Bacilli bacterium]
MFEKLTHSAFFVLVCLACLDILYGYIVACFRNESRSARLREGILTHFPILIGAGLLQYWAKDFNLELVASSSIGFLILMYVKSLRETYLKAGGIIPKYIDDLIPKDDPNANDTNKDK